MNSVLKQALNKWFGFDSFKPGQEDVINHVLAGEPTLGILPTGSGKSLCYQLPTYIKQQPTLIISPLISLMDDQVMQMKAQGERSVCHVHSGMDESEKKHNLQRLKHSRFVFLSPEFILQPQNFARIKDIQFGMIVLDEAHCISEWGYDFRPHYALMGKVTQHFNEATLLALTATAPPHLADDLSQMMHCQFQVVKTTMNRPNIALQHLNFEDDNEKIDWLLSFISHSGPTIIYVSSKKMCLTLAEAIYQTGYLTGIYHSDLTYQERYTVQQQFVQNEIPIIVATSAFGMGINKKDVRTVIHFHLATSPSNYMQEIGRAGRDGAQSQAISLYQPDDQYLLSTLLFTDMLTEEDVEMYEAGQFIEPDKEEVITTLNSYYSFADIKRIFKISFERKQQGYIKMLGYKNLEQCRRSYLLSFFNETMDTQPEYCCDCDSDSPEIDVKNRKKVKRKMDYTEKLGNLFPSH